MGEVGDNVLESLNSISQGVFLPLLNSPANQQGWPDVVAKEVTENMHKFIANRKWPLSSTGPCAVACGGRAALPPPWTAAAAHALTAPRAFSAAPD